MSTDALRKRGQIRSYGVAHALAPPGAKAANRLRLFANERQCRELELGARPRRRARLLTGPQDADLGAEGLALGPRPGAQIGLE